MVRSVVSNSLASSPMVHVLVCTPSSSPCLRLRKRKVGCPGRQVKVAWPWTRKDVPMAASYELSEEHQDFRESVAEFAADQLAPHVDRWNAAHELPLEAVKQMGHFGLFGLS